MCKDVEHNSPLLKYELHIMTTFQKVTYKNEDKSNFKVAISNKYHIHEMTEVNINSDESSS